MAGPQWFVADVGLEHDLLPADTKEKEYHYTEAAANLNFADGALQAAGVGEEVPLSVSLGKGAARSYPVCRGLIHSHPASRSRTAESRASHRRHHP